MQGVSFMRELIKEFVQICTETLPLEGPVYEFGSFQVPGQEGFADLRVLFPGKQYVGSDMREGPGVDVVLDLHDIALPANSVGTVLVMETLEHVALPHRAMEEVHRITRPGGVAIISSVMKMGIRAYPSDYWRFTPEGFRVLLRPFTDSLVSYAGTEKFPHTVIGIGFKGHLPALETLTTALAQWQARWLVARHESVLGKWTRKLKKSSRKRWNALVHRT
jgi:SAM-dependent methyltransferase